MSALELVRAARIIPVLRDTSPEAILAAATTLREEGFSTLEMTFTVPDTASLIQDLSARGAVVGAGTVLTERHVEAAAAAGARFLVSPGYDERLQDAARASGLPWIPGVFTPSEVMRARAAGCRVLKLFPGDLGGPALLRALKGPFPDLHFMPTGGVSAATLSHWAAAGAVAVGVGGSLTGDPARLRENARALRRAHQEAPWTD